ncbi:phosphotransferase IIA-like nitrogen-regulatory protein PtsN [Tamilnaduibacter salinus]|uniref:PTS IIA-like nitrogen-regulatory protein PtsN n=1 Tax=Tamilnaduibacter salinus TaxID=1484056 RepID=A0A2A2I160_9GAMM|nr:PTS IIA-like nitrogen regulatory protein PtsN [Tamilnaduibacter salinus]PAV25342.1 PTS IIA-like nitrogen-regulatory protein PtsN [Tamilnaduibacter salinus]PVY70757.1 phosphotransferase IIA-like nitrogen-regulatory protein PtsN [Tamilnaduibacter salinus]
MTETSLSIESILAPELTLCGVPGTSKKRILELIAENVARQYPELESTRIFNNLISRERLGSTGIGEGIAIPHCRLENCDRVVGVLMTLEDGISFDAIDHQPVDLVFTLIVPREATSEHLELLSQLAETFNNRTFCERLRQCEDSESLYREMTRSS